MHQVNLFLKELLIAKYYPTPPIFRAGRVFCPQQSQRNKSQGPHKSASISSTRAHTAFSLVPLPPPAAGLFDDEDEKKQKQSQTRGCDQPNRLLKGEGERERGSEKDAKRLWPQGLWAQLLTMTAATARPLAAMPSLRKLVEAAIDLKVLEIPNTEPSIHTSCFRAPGMRNE